MDEKTYSQKRDSMNSKPMNKQELILFRLDAIDKKLVDLQVLMTQTALQEQKIAELEKSLKEMNDYPLLRKTQTLNGGKWDSSH